jgi:SAM-dependent methyltransferase
VLPFENDQWLETTTSISTTTTRRQVNHRIFKTWIAGMSYGYFGNLLGAEAYTISEVEPDEAKIYAEAQKKEKDSGSFSLKILWMGAGDMKGVFKNLFWAGNEVIALDLKEPDATDRMAAITYATEHGYSMQFVQGDATHLNFSDENFDVVVCSLFLCQDFDPTVVVKEIQRVLKPSGRFGFYEHVEDINKVVVDRVFGESSIVQLQAYPEVCNIMAGVVEKI